MFQVLLTHTRIVHIHILDLYLGFISLTGLFALCHHFGYFSVCTLYDLVMIMMMMMMMMMMMTINSLNSLFNSLKIKGLFEGY